MTLTSYKMNMKVCLVKKIVCYLALRLETCLKARTLPKNKLYTVQKIMAFIEVKKFRLEKNKREIVRRTFKCKFSGVYRAQKKADIEDTRECESVRMNCPWNINLRLT